MLDVDVDAHGLEALLLRVETRQRPPLACVEIVHVTRVAASFKVECREAQFSFCLARRSIESATLRSRAAMSRSSAGSVPPLRGVVSNVQAPPSPSASCL